MPDGILDPQDAYKCESNSVLLSVCYVPEKNILLVSEAVPESNALWGFRLVPLSSHTETNEWHSNLSLSIPLEWPFNILCALCDARVLCGEKESNHIAFYRVNSGGRFALVDSVRVEKKFNSFAATRGTDTIVAMSTYSGDFVILYRLVGNDESCQLQELSTIKLTNPGHLLWIGDTKLIATAEDEDSLLHSLVDFEVRGNQLVRLREKPLHTSPDRVTVKCWCLMEKQIALFDADSYQLHIYPVPV